MSVLAFQLLMLASTIADRPMVYVRTMDWESIAPLKVRAGPLDGLAARSHLNDIIVKKRCDLGNARVDHYDNLTVRYALLIAPDGQVKEVVVEPKNCRPLESLVAAMVIEPRFVHRIVAPGGTKDSWYRAQIIFKGEQ